MGRLNRNSVEFDDATAATKPAWFRLWYAQQKAAKQGAEPPPATTTLPEPQKPAKRPRGTKDKPSRQRTARTRNAGTITEAAYWGMMRSGLRRLFRFWKPATAALRAARVPCKGPRGQKWAYLCSDCAKPFPRSGVQIDHVIPVGRLLCYDDLPGFVARLTPEDPAAYACRCKACHQKKTNTERTL